ncbi:MAG: hypothetical protein DHS20C21_16250 [Gemmatimonadota bacterium]|nr:MAG: hypothetical protein DHS20C21_16250 [Gemmatimonadota bacterium]
MTDHHRASLTFAILAVLAVMSLAGGNAYAQGCVRVSPMGCGLSQSMDPSSGILGSREWQVSTDYQYFRSFRHFRGDEEEANRVEDGTEVINRNHSMDLGLEYGLTDRLGIALNVPVLFYDRSSLYEHYGNSPASNPGQDRFHTGAQGVGDVRLTGSYWLFDPMTSYRGNLSLGFGIKAPTGDSNVQDTFHKLAADGSDSLVTKAVDQSIQPGDGGWGFTLEGQGYRSLFSRTSVYFSAFYLFNPREVNDVPHSVADQYSARAGFDYALLPEHGLSASLGGRWEGVPSEDWIGGSQGRRRPGYAVSVEPGATYRHRDLSFTLNVPIAVYRNRTQSVSDKERTAETGEWRQGDAAFADYLVSFSISKRFGSHHDMMMDVPTVGGE